eukprot:PITA_28560
MEGCLYDRVVSILIDLGSNYNYASLELVDKCVLNKEVYLAFWLVSLGTTTKKTIHHWVRVCAFELNVIPTSAHLNVLPFGSYGMLLDMDWLFTDRNKLDCYENAIECLDGHGDKRILQGKDVEGDEVLKRYIGLQQFQDVFPSDIFELLPYREVDFSIEFVPGTTSTSKEPYRMSTPQLVELEFQLNEIVDKGYIRPSVSP